MWPSASNATMTCSSTASRTLTARRMLPSTRRATATAASTSAAARLFSAASGEGSSGSIQDGTFVSGDERRLSTGRVLLELARLAVGRGVVGAGGGHD